MTSFRSKYYSTLDTVLATAVADAGTTTIAYPSGTAQGDFDKGLANLTGCYAILNNNDRIPYGTSGVRIGTITFGASNITITNNSGYTWPIGTVIDLHLDVKLGQRIPFNIPLPPLSGITAADILTDFQPGIDGTIEYAEFVTTVAVTTAAKAATLNFEVGTTDITGLTLALTSATATPKGKVLEFGLPTAGNTITRASKLSLEASSVTAFVEGEGYITLYIRPTQVDQY